MFKRRYLFAFLLLSLCKVSAFAIPKPQSPLKSKGSSTLLRSSAATEIRGGGLPLEPPPLPTLRDYRRFALPCLALWIAGPLLSLVDTSFIGLNDPTARSLAALGPATTFIDGATYLFAFLNVATTNLYASARSQQQTEKAESVVKTAARVATLSGIGLMIFLLVACPPLLRVYMGKAAETPGLLQAAVDYVRIRALSMPTSLLLGVLQAALLGAKDSVTPLKAIAYCTVVSIFGDYLLVQHMSWSLRGAAIASTLAQWAATAALMGPARRQLVRDGKLFQKKKTSSTKEGSVSGKVFLAFAAPVLTLILGKIAAFGFMTNAAASVPGQPTALAAHQILLSLFFFCSPFLEVISQTAQTFLPPYLAPVQAHIVAAKKRVNWTSVQGWWEASTKVARRLLQIGSFAAIFVATIASTVLLKGGHLITADAVVQEAVKPVIRYWFWGVTLLAPVAVAEGVLLARRELTYLASIYLTSTALLPTALVKVSQSGGTVANVWACFAVFQAFRAVGFVSRMGRKPREFQESATN